MVESGQNTEMQEAIGAAPQVDLCGVRFHAITESQCVDLVLTALEAGRGGWVVPMNLDVLRLWLRNQSIQEICNGATIFLADGMPLLWAAALQGTPLPQRVCGSNLILSLSRAAAEAGRSVFLLGGDEGMADAAAQTLVRTYPALRIAGTYYPPFGFEKDEAQMLRLRDAISQASPDIIYVALGFPKQEQLIRRLRPVLPRAWWMGVGISFSFVAGQVQRAPRWMQRAGLEWLHRLIQEPRRLCGRYLVHGLPFAAMLLASSGARRLARRRRFAPEVQEQSIGVKPG